MTDARANEREEDLHRFINQVWTMLILGSLVMVAIGEIFTPEIIRVLAYGFHGHKRAQTILMARIMVPSIIFWVSAGFLTGILQSGENFFGITLSPLVVNVVQIFGILVLGHFFHIIGVAWGFTLAIAAQLALLLPMLRRRRIRLRLTWPLNHPRLGAMLRLMGPYLLISSTASVEVIIDRMLASSMATGSISAMNFAFTVSQVPLGIIIAPIITPIYTRLAVLHADAAWDRFQALAMRGLRWVLLVTLPLSLVLFILNVPILRVVYERGHFNAASLHLTSHLFLFAIIALPANALSSYLQQMSFATKNTRRPAQFNFVAVLVNIAGNLILTRFMGVVGLVLATSIANWTNALLLAWSFNARRHIVSQWPFVLALLVAGGSMAAVLTGLSMELHMGHASGFLAVAVKVGASALAALAIYGGLLLLFRVPEARQLRRYAMRVVRRMVAVG
jgi:putative peptidoglycan lipid II flippase